MWRPLHKSIKQKSEILHYVQNDNTGPFCHSEEQGDEDVIFFLKLHAPQGYVIYSSLSVNWKPVSRLPKRDVG